MAIGDRFRISGVAKDAVGGYLTGWGDPAYLKYIGKSAKCISRNPETVWYEYEWVSRPPGDRALVRLEIQTGLDMGCSGTPTTCRATKELYATFVPPPPQCQLTDVKIS